ncbi:hypothetical protein RSAG8_05342, partial [Rhizoctonia solani AG-8 WAC10335]
MLFPWYCRARVINSQPTYSEGRAPGLNTHYATPLACVRLSLVGCFGRGPATSLVAVWWYFMVINLKICICDPVNALNP